MKKVKLCKDCKWLVGIMCKSSHNIKGVNLVNGETQYRWDCAETQRSGSMILNYLFGDCGPTGRFFEPKETNNPPKE